LIHLGNDSGGRLLKNLQSDHLRGLVGDVGVPNTRDGGAVIVSRRLQDRYSRANPNLGGANGEIPTVGLKLALG
jgi:hypothetical protein